MPFEFFNGLFALAVLVPFIIIYLRRPKLIEESVPSLMFFSEDKGANRRFSFLRNFLRNLLFLLQLLFLLALAFSIARPYLQMPSSASAGDVVVVLDASASMQAADGAQTRFSAAVAWARSQLGMVNTIILAEHIPVVVADKVSRDAAEKMLSMLRPRDTPTNLGDALLAAGDIARPGSLVAVISDFKPTAGPDLLAAKRVLASKDISIKFLPVGSNATNSGIIGLQVEKTRIKVTVMNFDTYPKKQTLSAQGVSQSRTIAGNSVELFTFNSTQGKSEVRLEPTDDLPLDNTAYVSIPQNRKPSVLFITNGDGGYLQLAFSSMPDIQFEIARPPVLPSLKYDIVVLYKYSEDLLLPGFYADLSRRIGNGTSVILTGGARSYPDFVPVQNVQLANSSQLTVTGGYMFTKDITFGTVGKYYKASAKNGSVVIAADKNGSAVVVLSKLGQGNVVYYGIADETSDFRLSPSYPIFWSQLVNYLASSVDLHDFNVDTTKSVILNEQIVATPEGTLTASRLMLDKQGFYSFDSKDVAANLINSQESDISTAGSYDDSAFVVEKMPAVRRQLLEPYLLAAGLVLLLLELVYIKRRGDA